MGLAVYPLYFEIIQMFVVAFATLIFMWRFPRKSKILIICAGASTGIIFEIILGPVINGVSWPKTVLNPFWYINPLRPVLVVFIILASVTFWVGRIATKHLNRF